MSQSTQKDTPWRVISVNVNGLRSAEKKGLLLWLREQQPDVVCLQETRIQADQMTEALALSGYHARCVSAQKKGYSGVAIWSRQEPTAWHESLGYPLSDDEGRYIQADFGQVSVASMYWPSGTSGEKRQEEKMAYLAFLKQHFKKLRAQGRSWIISGDFNVVHTQKDITNWKSNQKSSGCRPEERAFLDHFFTQEGWVDAFRYKHPDAEAYSWWSHRGRARANNVGWRIDYHMLSPDLASSIEEVRMVREPFFSDHAPVVLDCTRACIERMQHTD